MLLTEFETFKSEAMHEIDRLKEKHKLEVNQLLYEIKMLNDMCEHNVDKESFKRVKAGILNFKIVIKKNLKVIKGRVTICRMKS